MRIALPIFVGLLAAQTLAEAAGRVPPVAIPAGIFKPMFGSEGQDLPIGAFWLDRIAVSNRDFQTFVHRKPEWSAAKISQDRSDENYLSHWIGATTIKKPRKGDLSKPVTNVSWFAAQSFCEDKGGRLPTTLEWEYVAAASKTKANATRDPNFQAKILFWYSNRDLEFEKQKSSEENFYRVVGLHGLIWEWTSDFNSFFVAADNRQDGDQSKNFFCGAGATNAENRDGYAAFMRYALRGSLNANYSLKNLGFRCAYDHE